MLTLLQEVLHVPPETVLVSDVVEPTHTASGPPMAEGPATTVTVLVVVQKVAGVVYVIIAVPALLPVNTLPEKVAIPAGAMLQVPPVGVLAIVTDELTQ